MKIYLAKNLKHLVPQIPHVRSTTHVRLEPLHLSDARYGTDRFYRFGQLGRDVDEDDAEPGFGKVLRGCKAYAGAGS